MAVGIFFGWLVPIAQIPLSVGAAIVMRANVPAAVSSTLVSNPLTFAPIYYLAYRTGLLVTGDEVRHPERELARITARADADEARAGGVRGVVERVRALVKPLIIGLAIFAVAGGLLAYVLIWAGWWLWVHRKRRRKVARYARVRAGTLGGGRTGRPLRAVTSAVTMGARAALSPLDHAPCPPPLLLLTSTPAR